MFGNDKVAAPKVLDSSIEQLQYNFNNLGRRFEALQLRFSSSEAFVNVERAKEMEQRWRTRVQDCQDFMHRLMLRMDAIATENRELISDNYEMKRFLQVLGLEIKARANGGGSVAPPAPNTE